MLVFVSGFGGFFEFVVDLLEEFLGFCGVAVHVEFVGFLGFADFLEGLIAETLVEGICGWAEANIEYVQTAREVYDRTPREIATPQ